MKSGGLEPVLSVVRSRTVLVVLAHTLAVIQGLDAIVGFIAQNRIKTIGPAVLAVITILAIVALLQHQEG